VRAGDRTLIPVAALLWGLQFAFLNPSIGLLLASLYDASAAQVGWALAAYNISGFVSTMIVPARADRAGDYVRPMVWCGILTVLLVTALALSTTLPMAVLALVALGGPAGVGVGLLFAHQRSTDASVEQVMRTRAVFSFAWVAGPPIATLLIGFTGPRSVLWAIGLIALVCVAVTVALQRTRTPAAAGGAESTDDRGALALLADPEVARLVAAFTLLSAANNAAISTTTLLVTDRLDLDPVWGGVALAVAAGLEIPALLLLGRLSGRIDTRRLLAVGAVVAVAYYAVITVTQGPLLLVVAQVLNAIGVAAVSGIGLTVMQDVVPRPGLASGLFMNTYRGGAVLAGPLVAVGGSTSLGYGATFLAAAVVAAISLPLLILSAR